MQGYKNIFQFLSLFLFTQQICDVTSNVIQIQLHPIREDRNYHVPYQQGKDVSYTAAVVEFAPVESLTDPPSLILSTNMAEYQNFVHQAKNQGADIIVFPEYGLTSTYPSDNRSLAREYGQIIPSPDEFLNPCNTYNSSMEYETLRRLSCYAKDSSIYLVANIIEKFPCEGCADDNVLLYNTNVAFDRYGNVITRYRKFNLFAEFALNQTTLPEHSTFVADFGAKFGLITCFDIMFESPAVTLVTEYHVTDIIFPSAWIQELPFLTAVQTQTAWSLSHHVNILAAGYNGPPDGNTGSSITHGMLGVRDHYMAENTGNKLIVAQMPPSRQPRNKQNLNYPKINSKYNKIEGLYTSRDILNNYNYIKLSEIYGIHQNLNICHNTICCELNYEINSLPPNIYYHLLVYDGIRTHANGRYPSKLQVCALVACGGDDINSCSDGFLNSTYTKTTEFAYLQLKGKNVKTTKFWPNTLLSNTIGPIESNKLLFQKLPSSKVDGLFDIILEHKDIITNVHTFGIYAHDYEPNFGVKLQFLPFMLFVSILLIFLR